jgi:hypothetical protein
MAAQAIISYVLIEIKDVYNPTDDNAVTRVRTLDACWPIRIFSILMQMAKRARQSGSVRLSAGVRDHVDPSEKQNKEWHRSTRVFQYVPNAVTGTP